MMVEFVDVAMVSGLGLPYEPGAHAFLGTDGRDPAFATAWDALVAAFPAASLDPLFDVLPLNELADLVDAARTRGEVPPELYSWFTVPCDDAVVDSVAAAMAALPFVEWAARRPTPVPAGRVSWGTNPITDETPHLEPTPKGVDAIHAWHVPGGTGESSIVADVEHGWDLAHEELLSAHIEKTSVFGSSYVAHGTGTLGILVAQDNGVGMVGVVPDAHVKLVTNHRQDKQDMAAAILLAAKAIGPGGVLLIELALPYHPGSTGPDVLVELHRPHQAAILAATVLFGVTVIEPAGNGNVDLDEAAGLDHVRAVPPGIDSGAVVVGSGTFDGAANWFRSQGDDPQSGSCFGGRVNCFASGEASQTSVLAPDGYGPYAGTSGASAIIAGVAAAIQGMSVAATGFTLAPTDLRRLLSDHSLGTQTAVGFGGVGAMPDLRKIARSQGWSQILPVSATATFGDSLVLAYLDQDDRLIRRHWAFFGGWDPPLPTPNFGLVPCQPTLSAWLEQDPLARMVWEVLGVGSGVAHHLWWDSLGQSGDLTKPITPKATIAPGHSLAAVRAADDAMVVVGTDPLGRLVRMRGDPSVHLSGGLSAPQVLDMAGSYRRSSGAATASRKVGLVDVVAIEDGGAMRFFTGTTLATVGTGWSDGVSELTTVFEPGARPALLVIGDELLAAGVGTEGWLRVVRIDPATGMFDTPVVVDVQTTLETAGPVALGLVHESVVALAVSSQSTLCAATRPVAGGDWTPLIPLESDGQISPLGGAVAVSLDIGMMALAVGPDGTVQWALTKNGIDWALQPVPSP